MTPEDAELCARLRQPFRSGEPVNDLCVAAADHIEALAAEVDVLRRVVRAADYLAVAGQDSRYDEAREALTEFDRAAQEKGGE